MLTTRGEMLEEELVKEVKEAPVPCGTCRTTTYYASDGELVRQDILIVTDGTFIPQLGGIVGDL